MSGIYQNNAKYEKPNEFFTEYDEIQNFYN